MFALPKWLTDIKRLLTPGSRGKYLKLDEAGAWSFSAVETANADWNATSGLAEIFHKPVLFSGNYADLAGKPALFSGNYVDLSGKPALFSGAYADLTGKPNLATIAATGDYRDLSNAPVSGAGKILSQATYGGF